MTAHPLTTAPATRAALRPPMTRASADRLFWRQEGAHHWPLWVNGLALWIWLFLVPGQTTEESQVLRWSILWTGVLALVALLCCLAAAHFHGMIMGLVYAGGVWLAAYGCAGEYPLLVSEWDMAGGARAPTGLEYQNRALSAGLFSLVLAVCAWTIGTLHSARRTPIHTSGQTVSLVSIAVALVGGLAILQLLLVTFLQQGAGVIPFLTTAMTSISVFDADRFRATSPLSWWTGLAWLEAGFFVAWMLVRFRARRQGETVASARWKHQWWLWLAGTIALGHLFAQPVLALRAKSPDLDRPWLHHLDFPQVTSTQSWDEAYNRPRYTSTPAGYEIAFQPAGHPRTARAAVPPPQLSALPAPHAADPAERPAPASQPPGRRLGPDRLHGIAARLHLGRPASYRVGTQHKSQSRLPGLPARPRPRPGRHQLLPQIRRSRQAVKQAGFIGARSPHRHLYPSEKSRSLLQCHTPRIGECSQAAGRPHRLRAQRSRPTSVQ